MSNVSYAVKKCRERMLNASEPAINDLRIFKGLVESQRAVASKHTHYDRLNDWSDIINEFVHKSLEVHGFVSGEPEINKTRPDAFFWWSIYSMVNSVIYSPHLKTTVSAHHSSAYERNEALLMEINDILNQNGTIN